MMQFRNRRHAKKTVARYRRHVRRGLVHAAGCVLPDCASHECAIEEALEYVARGYSVRVPRTLRARFKQRHTEYLTQAIHDQFLNAAKAFMGGML